MKHLYDESDLATEDGERLREELHRAVEPIMLRWSMEGYSIRDIAHIGSGVVDFNESAIALRRALARRRKEP